MAKNEWKVIKLPLLFIYSVSRNIGNKVIVKSSFSGSNENCISLSICEKITKHVMWLFLYQTIHILEWISLIQLPHYVKLRQFKSRRAFLFLFCFLGNNLIYRNIWLTVSASLHFFAYFWNMKGSHAFHSNYLGVHS